MKKEELEYVLEYEKVYSKYIDDYEIRGEELVSLCPFHDEASPSFNANLSTGLYHCFGCGESGNATTFIANMERINTKEAWKKLQDIIHPKYRLSTYSKEKNLPIDFLEKLGLKDEEYNISIPYFDEKKSNCNKI